MLTNQLKFFDSGCIFAVFHFADAAFADIPLLCQVWLRLDILFSNLQQTLPK